MFAGRSGDLDPGAVLHRYGQDCDILRQTFHLAGFGRTASRATSMVKVSLGVGDAAPWPGKNLCKSDSWSECDPFRRPRRPFVLS